MKINGFNKKKITDIVLEIESLQVKKCNIKNAGSIIFFLPLKWGNNSIFSHFSLKKKKMSYFPFPYGNKADVGSAREF